MDVFSGHDFAEVVVGGAAGTLVFLVDPFLCRVAARGVHIADRHDLEVRHLDKVRQVIAAHHHADADEPQRDLLVGRDDSSRRRGRVAE